MLTIGDQEELGRLISENPQAIEFLTSLKAGNYAQNIVNGKFINITTNAVADTEDAFVHGLVDADGVARIPKGFIVVDLDKGAVIYKGTTAWTDTNIYLRSNVVTVAAKVWVF